MDIKTSFQIDVLDDSILSEFFMSVFFFFYKKSRTKNSISPRNYRAIFLRLTPDIIVLLLFKNIIYHYLKN